MFESHQVQNELEAYLLGFLYADGYVTGEYHGRYYLLGIGLKAEDKDFLQWICDEFNKAFNKSIKIKYQEKTNSYKWEIGNIILVSNLISLGIIPHKTYENNSFVFDNVPDNLKRHFIRGYFDGDGSLYRRTFKNNTRTSTAVTLTSTMNFCKAVSDICAEYIGINSGIYDASCHNGITSVFSICGNNVCKKFLDWIYKDATICLERKYKRYVDYYALNNSLSA